MLKRKLEELQCISPHVAEIIKPLHALGIVGFFYVRIYPNGEFVDMTSNPAFAEHYFRKFFRGSYSPQAVSDHLFIEQGVSLWELNAHNLIHQDGRNIFSYGNGITLCENHPGYKEIYNFYARADQSEMNAFYLRQLDFLRKFKAYFVEKASLLIEEAEQSKCMLPDAYRTSQNALENSKVSEILAKLAPSENEREPLTPRETECLMLLSKGFSAQEAADHLDLSRRTVENYIANIKSKWHCSKLTELMHEAYAVRC